MKSVHHFLRFDSEIDTRFGPILVILVILQYDPHWLSSSERIRAPPHSDGALIIVPSLQPLILPDGQSRPMNVESPMFELFVLKNIECVVKSVSKHEY